MSAASYFAHVKPTDHEALAYVSGFIVRTADFAEGQVAESLRNLAAAVDEHLARTRPDYVRQLAGQEPIGKVAL